MEQRQGMHFPATQLRGNFDNHNNGKSPKEHQLNWGAKKNTFPLHLN